MKKLILVILALSIIVSVAPFRASADSVHSGDTQIKTIELEDGATIEIITETVKISRSSIISHVDYIYSESGTAKWKASLIGYFTYNGTTAVCTSSSLSFTIYDSAWSVSSSNATKSGATAIGTFTMAKKILGITVSTVSDSLTLTCDPNGNIT
ncbi:MAG: hypothetical protein IJS72_01965 [Oscillospiraceae bacterium]|nr:hypothetical protein [Oscillospiraceae bacterium]